MTTENKHLGSDFAPFAIEQQAQIIEEMQREIDKLKADNEWQIQRNHLNTAAYCDQLAEAKKVIEFYAEKCMCDSEHFGEWGLNPGKRARIYLKKYHEAPQ